MKKVGIIGGLSYESTAKYYTDINKATASLHGGLSEVELILINVNLKRVIGYAENQAFDLLAGYFIEIAQQLEKSGADFIIIPCNSFHNVADKVQAAINIPLFNMIDCVGEYIVQHAYSKVALLGSAYTMDADFYQERLFTKFQVETVVPDQFDREKLHRIIVEELCQGCFSNNSRHYIQELGQKLYEHYQCGAVILGCTELPMIINPCDVRYPTISSIDIHIKKVIDEILDLHSFSVEVYAIEGVA